jgi:hypothetical protein
MVYQPESLLWNSKGGTFMAHAIIRGANGRRHEVDFEGVEVQVEIFFGDAAVEIAVEATDDLAPSDKRRMALLNVPSDLFNKALGDAARRGASKDSAIRKRGG